MNRNRKVQSLGRFAALGTTGGVLAVTALMLILPAASALTITKPFKGFPVSVGDNKSWGACGKIHEVKVPKWNTKMGLLTENGSATSPTCHTATASQNFADWITQINMIGTLKFPHNGTYNITNFWKVAWSASWNTTPFVGCKLNYAATFSACSAYAEVEFYGQQFIYDQTTGTNSALAQSPTGFPASFANFSSAENYSSNSCPTCTPSGGNFSSGVLAGTFTGVTITNSTIQNYTANNLDTYYYNVFCIVWVLTSAETTNAHFKSGGSATAAVNLAGPGRGVTLGSIVIT